MGGGGVGGLDCATFPGTSFPHWDSSKSWRLDLCLCWIAISFINELNGGPRSKVEDSRNQAQLKTSNSSSESSTSTTSSSSLLARWEEVATLVACDGGEATFGMPSSIGSAACVPFGIRPESRKPEAAMLIHCSRGSLALMTHLGAKKLLEIRT